MVGFISSSFLMLLCLCLNRVDLADIQGDEKARKLKPDLILLDAAMPRTNGIVAASVLKEMMPNVPIILFTMYSEAIARAFPGEGLAVDAVVAKADGMSRLADCVQNLLRS